MPQKDNTVVYVLAGAAALSVSISIGLGIWWWTTTQNKGDEPPPEDGLGPPPTTDYGPCEGDACDQWQCPQGFVETSTVCAATASEDKKQCWHPAANLFSRRVCKTTPECAGNQPGVSKTYVSEAGCPIGFKMYNNSVTCMHPQTGQKILKPRQGKFIDYKNATRRGGTGLKALFKRKNVSVVC